MRLSRPVVAAMLVSVGAVTAYQYFRQVDYPFHDGRVATHRQLLEGAELSPFRYRVLVPFAVEGLIRGLSTALGPRLAFLAAYAVYDGIVFVALFGTLYGYLRRWFPPDGSLLAVLFTGATMPVALRDHYFQPWSPLEVVLFTAGLWLASRRRHAWLALVVVAAALNRETALFLVVALLLADLDVLGPWRERPPAAWRGPVLRGALHLGLWLAVFAGLRVALGPAPPAHTLGEIWAINTTAARGLRALATGVLFLGAFWAFAALGWRTAPRFAKNAALVVPAYLVAMGLFGEWHETRLLMTLYPFLLPLVLGFLYGPRPVGGRD